MCIRRALGGSWDAGMRYSFVAVCVVPCADRRSPTDCSWIEVTALPDCSRVATSRTPISDLSPPGVKYTCCFLECSHHVWAFSCVSAHCAHLKPTNQHQFCSLQVCLARVAVSQWLYAVRTPFAGETKRNGGGDSSKEASPC